ncbi:5-(carboxyamino)imidazole ribonucleotide synthase [Rhodobacteraceae bacterium NNCM2]|nr:5-(carboxyamino)imidazole ribonucleotide synthase [Coraliihabitans acroporae]
MTEPLAPGGTIGILGGGQLGRMLSIAAARLGMKCHIFEPGANPPAGDVAAKVTTAPYEDEAALAAFASEVDVITFEFENVPAEALDLLESHAPIRPGRNALAVSQDRLTEKAFLADLGVPVAPHAKVDDLPDLQAAFDELGAGILKTRRFGYDGKGQVRISAADQIGSAIEALAGAPAILEALVPFQREISVIAARGLSGEVVCYDPGENVHRDGILDTTTVNEAAGRGIRAEAALMAGKILNALDYVGVMGVEMFVLPGNKLMVNEIAPRVHNSGHWTIEACVIDQFQQHIRAVCGWPLGDGSRHSDALMTNLIGDDVERWRQLAGEGVGIHLYGKAESRPGRKMGHVTAISPKG